MKLKKIIVFGFKSFPDKTSLEFLDGITCIVGPNGCGKSNIGDAVRWVLGEQSAKSMRSPKMYDVIFSGTTKRKPLNFAEVTIVFDEVNQTLNVPYEELAITRRLDRSGDSEYLINRQPVRLKDIQQLLMDTGIGKTHFSIFEQGKIDQLIQYSPIERRSIFETAAGISKFIENKEKTCSKLEAVSQNLLRLEDIHKEILSQAAVLRIQAEEAKIYKDKKETLIVLEKGVIFNRFENLNGKYEAVVEKEQALKTLFAELENNYAGSQKRREESKGTLKEKQAAYSRAKEALAVKDNECKLQMQSQVHSKERLDEIKKKQASALAEISGLTDQQKQWIQDIEQLKLSKEKATLEFTLKENALKTCEKEFEILEKHNQEIRNQQLTLSQERVKAYQKQVELQSEWKQTKNRQETYLERKGILTERKGQLEGLEGLKEIEVQEKQKEYERFQNDLRQLKLKLTDFEGLIKVSQKALQEIQRKKQQLIEKHQVSKGREEALIQLKKEFVGFTSGGKTLLKESNKKESALFGLIKGLSDYIIPDPIDLEKTQTILKKYSDVLIVETIQDLKLILDFAETKKIKDFSLLCLDLIQLKRKKLDAHLSFEALTCENKEEAIAGFQKEKAPIWVSKNFFIDEKGIINIPSISEHSVFSRDHELRLVQKELEEIHASLEILNVESEIEVKKEKDLLEQFRNSDQEIRKLEMKGIEINFGLQKTKAEKERLKKEILEVFEESQQISEVGQRLEAKEQELFSRLTETEQAVNRIQSHLENNQQQVLGIDQTWQDKRASLQNIRAEFNGAENEFRKVVHAFNLMEVKNQETSRLIERLRQEASLAMESEAKWGDKQQTAQISILELEALLKKMQAQVVQFRESCQLAENAFNQEDVEAEKSAKAFKEVDAKWNLLKLQLVQLETQRAALEQEIEEKTSCSLEEFLKDNSPLKLSLDKAEHEIKSLKNYFNSNPSINLAAIEDCENKNIRANELHFQITDLINSKEELLKLMKEIEEESRTLFSKTFEAIRINFRKNFSILFNGGEADLELEPSKDILQAGIEIIAKPPGKQMRSLSLLSGGEKCLTAMALLFAIFEVKAAPFCILDEIDAPLDESNVERFLNMVRHFADRCQFIIVTHNKRTMSLGDRLYGVSMEEKGVSKLISMEFSQSNKPELTLVSI